MDCTPYREKITPQEMETLVAAGTKIYLISAETESCMTRKCGTAIQVMLFDRNKGTFTLLNRGVFQQAGEDKSFVKF